MCRRCSSSRRDVVCRLEASLGATMVLMPSLLDVGEVDEDPHRPACGCRRFSSMKILGVVIQVDVDVRLDAVQIDRRACRLLTQVSACPRRVVGVVQLMASSGRPAIIKYVDVVILGSWKQHAVLHMHVPMGLA